VTNIALWFRCVRQRTDGGRAVGENVGRATIGHSRENPTMIPTAIPNDAIAYTQLARGQPRLPGSSSPAHCESGGDSLTASDLQVMRELSISLEAGCFVFEGYQYDRLIDAANYARHRRSIAVTG
jgi:hypothetical protein